MDPISFPFRGVSDRTAFAAQAGNVVPPWSMENCRAFDVEEDRGRGGQRPGIWPIFTTQICGGQPIQCLAVVSKASQITDYRSSGCMAVTDWENRNGDPITGQIWMLGVQPAMFRDFADSRFGGASTKLPTACKWHPLITNDIRRAFYAASFVDASLAVNGGSVFIGISCIDELGAVIWSANLEDKNPGGSLPVTPHALYANHLEVVAPSLGAALVLVSVLSTDGTNSVGWIYVYHASDGTYLARYNIDGWASEVQQCVTRTDGTIAALFWGSGAVNGLFDMCLDGTPIAPGGFAQFFRSGIALFEVTGDLANPLRRVAFGPPAVPGSKVENLTHGTWRFSEQLRYRAPLGAYPTSIAAGPGSTLVVTFTNKGWGPNASYPPLDNASIYSTVAMLESDGTVRWENDTNSIRREYVIAGITYHNDLPDTGDPFGSKPPTLFACAVSSEGDIYVGGARNSSSADATIGYNLSRLDPIDGRIVWQSNVGGAAAAYSGGVSQAGLCVDPTDQNIVVAGYRNASYTGVEAARMAHLWKFSKDTGNPLWNYDLLTASCHAQSVDVDSRGRIVYATTFI